MMTAVMIIGAILGLGGMVAFFVLNLGNSIAVNAGVPGALLLLYIITILGLTVAGKRLRSFLGTSAGEEAKILIITIPLVSIIFLLAVGYFTFYGKKNTAKISASDNITKKVIEQNDIAAVTLERSVTPDITPEHPVTSEMVHNNGGISMMGSPSNEPGRDKDEGGQKQIIAGSQNTFQATHRVITNDRTNLRLREDQGTNANIIESLPYGSYVQVLSIGSSWVDNDGNRGNWTYVLTPSGNRGWCFGAYLQPR
jgi:hypothetical protein